MALALGGCATVDASDRGERTRTLWFVGVTRVVLPQPEGSVSAVDVKSLGLGWDAGPYLGWKAGNWIVADPSQCQLLIVIRSPAQAENAAKVIESLKGQNPCIADFTHSLRP